MAITSFQGRSTAVFKNVIKFVGGAALDGRTVVDTYSDISGENYKSLFTFEDNGSWVASYYTGMTVVTKDTGKLYVLTTDGVFKEVSPDVLGSLSENTYADAVAKATSSNIGQIIYVKKTTYKKGDAYTDVESEADVDLNGKVTEYSAAPYIVIGTGQLQKLEASVATGDISADLRELSGTVASLDEYVKQQDDILEGKIKAISDIIGNAEEGLVGDIAELQEADKELTAKFNNYYTTTEADNTFVKNAEFTSLKETVDDIPNVYLSKTEASSTYETQENVQRIDDKVATHTQLISDLSANINTVSGAVDALSKNVYTIESAKSAFNIDVSNSIDNESGIKSYVISQGTSTFTIDIPKDLMVKSGEVVDLAEGEVDGKPAGTYIRLVLNNSEGTYIYIAADSLVDEYTALEDGYIDISNREISIKYDDLEKAIITTADNKYVKVDDLEGIESGLTATITKAYTDAIATAQQAAINSAVATANKYADDIKKSLEESIEEFTTDIGNDISGISGSVDSLTERVSENEQSIGTINSNIATLSSQVKTLEDTVGNTSTGLVYAVTTNTTDIENIKGDIEGVIKTVVVAEHTLTAGANGTITIPTATTLDVENNNAVVTVTAVKNIITGKANVVIGEQDPENPKRENVYFVGSDGNGYVTKVLGSDGNLYIAGDTYFVRNTDLASATANGIMRAEDYTLLHSITSITTTELNGILYPEEEQEPEQEPEQESGQE